MNKLRQDLKQLIALDRKIEKLPKLSEIESEMLESENRFESTYYSNKLEGNELSKSDARKAIVLK